MSQRGLARGAGVGGHTISDLEGVVGYKTTIQKAERIAAALGRPLDELFTPDFPRVRQDKRVRTRAGAPAGSSAQSWGVELERYCREQGLWTALMAAEHLGVDAKMGTYLKDQGVLSVADVFVAAPFTAVLYRPSDVRRLARERRLSVDHRVRHQDDPLWVFMWAIKRGFTVERAEALRQRRIERNNRLAGLKRLSAEERHARWRERWEELQRENPEATPGSLIPDVALRDWQEHPEDWPRDRYPASRNDPDDIERRARESARNRVRKALQNAGKLS